MDYPTQYWLARRSMLALLSWKNGCELSCSHASPTLRGVTMLIRVCSSVEYRAKAKWLIFRAVNRKKPAHSGMHRFRTWCVCCHSSNAKRQANDLKTSVFHNGAPLKSKCLLEFRIWETSVIGGTGTVPASQTQMIQWGQQILPGAPPTCTEK